MADNNLERWKLLLSQIEVILEYPEAWSTLNKAQIEYFESENSLILPQCYKEFCQIFGCGEFGFNGFCIDIPYREDIKGMLISNEILLDCCKVKLSLVN